MKTVTHSRCSNGGSESACWDCGVETLSYEPGVATEYYMVHDEVWDAAGATTRTWLCIGCLESRLGRRLVPGDFQSAVVNDPRIYRADKAWSWRSDRLMDRLR